uniref:Periodic tryptophan protein 2 homolog n=1 Tax=Phallusia mammillata TaxID=59560 RepID=A0A6F9DQS2_9ASCI|nr:periodic tryptophan protein 2 homolog [Phallusia mammillata]
MKFGFKFSNLLGTVYRKGNVTFLKDGNTVVSPVGNRLSLFDLKSNKSETLQFTTKHNISCIAVSPDSSAAILVDEEGEITLINLISKTVLHRHDFRKPVNCVSFSPDGKKFAVCKDNVILMYHAPGKTMSLNPFSLYRTFYGAYNDVTCIDWTDDSRVFAVGGKDMNTRVYAAVKLENLVIYSLGGHKDEIVGCFFEKDSLDIYSVSRDGTLNVWDCDTDLDDLKSRAEFETVPYSEEFVEETELEEEETKASKTESEVDTTNTKILYTRTAKHFFNKEGDFNNVTSVSYHSATHILVTGFASGSFQIHELPDFNLIHTLSISEHKITASAFNVTGDWIALASADLGQLLVWEWQSETYIMKQQGHFNGMSCLDYSPDGRYIVTGGEDGKVKVWNTNSGFCFVTFSEHTAAITGVQFTSNGHVIMSSSIDGTVRAFDLHRYRNFRTFTAPRPTQFSCLAADGSGELVGAGSEDNFEIYVWSVRTGRLLDVLAAHEAPVSSIAFSPNESLLASGSWDHSAILWKIGDEKGARETIQIGHDVMSVAFRPDGKELAVSSLNAEISFWDVQTATQNGSVECRHDIGGGRSQTDRVSAKTSSYGKAFQTLCYTADGEAIIAGGQTKNVCVYHVREQMLMKKFPISKNLSFDAMEEFLDKRKMTEFGPSALIDMGKEDENGTALKLPGVRTGDLSSRSFKPEVRVSCIRFSPTGREWACTSTEGLMIYSLDSNLVFDPYDLDIDVTPQNIRKLLDNKDYSKAFIMSFRLNEKKLIEEVVEHIPHTQIDAISKNLPQIYVEKSLEFIAQQLDASPYIEFYLRWCRALLVNHGPVLKKRSNQVMTTMRHLQKGLTGKAQTIGKLCDSNVHQMRYILSLAKLQKLKLAKEPEAEEAIVGSESDESDDDLQIMSVAAT